MANVSFNDLTTSSNSGDRTFDVGFFSLKGDGAESVVRFAVDSLEDLEILTVHPITVGESRFPGNRRVNCLRSPRDPMHMCPLCAKGEKINQKVFIRMIQYTTDSSGKIIANPVVWERPAGIYATKLKSLLETFGPLSGMLFKVTRHGTGLDTTYDILGPLPAQMYPDTMYSAESFSKLEGYSVLGKMVMDKTVDDLNHFITYGEFPAVQSDNAASQQYTPTPAYTPQPQTPPVYAQSPQPVTPQFVDNTVPFTPDPMANDPIANDPILSAAPFGNFPPQGAAVTRPVRVQQPTKVY